MDTRTQVLRQALAQAITLHSINIRVTSQDIQSVTIADIEHPVKE